MAVETPNDEPFRIGELDAQLDNLASLAGSADTAANTPARAAYQSLAQVFAPRTAREAEAVARVRQRLAAALGEMGASAGTAAPAVVPAPDQPHVTGTRSWQLPGTPRRATPRRTFVGTAAAVLAVSCLLGGFVVVLHQHNIPFASGYHWQVVPSPNTPLAVNTLTGITMRTATDGWAWGDANVAPDNVNSNPINQPLVEHWDGHTWRIVATPVVPEGGTIADIVALAPDDAWAVGSQLTGGSENTSGTTLVEHWDGHHWTMVQDNVSYWPNGSGLSAVAALAADDIWAVGQGGGDTQTAMIQHWDGHSWRTVAHPALTLAARSHGPQFSSIAAISATDIWVAGGSAFEHWDGHNWRIVPAPSSSGFGPLGGYIEIAAISAASANDVWAAGFVNHKIWAAPVFEHWDGHSWSAMSDPLVQGMISGIVALGPNDVWAVGTAPSAALAIDVAQQGHGLIEHWDGKVWSLVAGPTTRPFTSLGGVAQAPSAVGKVWIAGLNGPELGPDQLTDTQTLIETNQ